MDGSASARFRLTLELHQAGVELMRQNLRRANPSWSEHELARAVGKWLAERPGAELGDGWGAPSRRFAARGA